MEKDYNKFKELFLKKKAPQFITSLLKLYKSNASEISEVLKEYPIYKLKADFWDNKFWKGQFSNILETLDTVVLSNLLNVYFKQEKKYNVSFLEFYIEKNPTLFNKLVKDHNSIYSVLHFRTFIENDSLFKAIKNIYTNGDLVNAIRKTEMYLSLSEGNFEKFGFLNQDTDEEILNHYKTFLDLRRTDNNFLDEIDKSDCLFFYPDQLLMKLTVWHIQRLERINSNDIHLRHYENLAVFPVYEFILEKISGRNFKKTEEWSNILDWNYERLFINIFTYVHWKLDHQEWYSFDDNIKFSRDEENNLMIIPNNQDEEIQWKKNGTKYEYFNTYYLLKSRDEIKSHSKNDMYSYKFNIDVLKNRNRRLLNDFNISNETLKLDAPISYYSDFLEILCQEILNDEKCYFEKKYEDLVNATIYLLEIPKEQASSIIDFFTYNLSKSVKGFNIDHKPLIRYGDNILFLSPLIRCITASHTTINNIFKSQNKFHSHPGKLVEQKIIDEFKFSDFTALSINQKSSKGDYDCIAYKDGVLFLVQVKSTYLRTTVKDNYLFTSREIAKASNQIDRNIKDLYDNFDLIKEDIGFSENSIKELDVVPLIITTSFENDGKIISSNFNKNIKIHKICLFELLVILRNEEEYLYNYSNIPEQTNLPYIPEVKRRKDSKDIKNCIINSNIWKLLKSEDYPVTQKYVVELSSTGKLFDKSIKESECGNIEKAKYSILEAIALKPKVSKYHTHLGDLYISQNNTDKAIEEYAKAIKINPKDSFAYYNKAAAYCEKGLLSDAYINLIEVVKLNPLDEHAINKMKVIEQMLLCRPEDIIRKYYES